MNHLILVIEAVEDANALNSIGWSDWLQASEILKAFPYPDEPENIEKAREILANAINTNGRSLAVDLPILEKQLFGKNCVDSMYTKIAEKYRIPTQKLIPISTYILRLIGFSHDFNTAAEEAINLSIGVEASDMTKSKIVTFTFNDDSKLTIDFSTKTIRG